METDRLTTLDEHGHRRFVIPAEVKGRFRTLRNRVYFGLIIFFLALPWIKLNGVQLFLFDIPRRRFSFFGQMFFAHDTPLLFLILFSAVLILAGSTAIWGRLWCGWACPQTVFIDGVYRNIEIWIEGNYIQRRKLREAGPSFERIWKGAVKWFLYFIVSSIISHSLIAFFAGSDELLRMMAADPHENWTYFLVVTFFTILLMFDFGWFREQFCTIMCPYGRFQSVLMGENSLAILYDEKRGEPRKGLENGRPRGDCVSCNRCVEVCPAKIDIRKGLQMECIACTACIDACDEIMQKVKKPDGLIRYQSIKGTGVEWRQPRALLYLGVATVLLLILSVQVVTHAPFEVTILRGKDTPYQLLADEKVLNHFKLHLFNQSRRDREFTFSPSAENAAQGVQFTESEALHHIRSGESRELHVFVTFPKALLNAKGELPVDIRIEAQGLEPLEKRITAVGPEKTN